ncbi:hypothetical protein AK812_SmicGene30920 [Symbiodinium microadriaticum]|uniref:Uncharacterized protein n=1 Tax=Symbiodinium microadriaticum TaxID=2951 RepID=A0A1Q9CY76_SYMMI|nr:hypothetical protein AK812_SmicGene30920 [Symbiodinium microadriaticum]
MRLGLLILLLVSSGADPIASGVLEFAPTAADAEDVPLRETTQLGRGGGMAVLDRTPRFLQTNSSDTTDATSNSTSTANDSTLEITAPGSSQNNSSDLQWWGVEEAVHKAGCSRIQTSLRHYTALSLFL